ncbi:hypothetical protein PoB_005877900 [Plakobranchus ocellatus]|uniref:Uncharacterized protein n=1 Tax=Plakobranchus ocellatus TaxID=259542 RepID=A0AAV4CLT5_9GAST|nr:hypothetical protein PoB_005877900 [Plakobranchus ocellatus]
MTFIPGQITYSAAHVYRARRTLRSLQCVLTKSTHNTGGMDGAASLNKSNLSSSGNTLWVRNYYGRSLTEAKCPGLLRLSTGTGSALVSHQGGQINNQRAELFCHRKSPLWIINLFSGNEPQR